MSARRWPSQIKAQIQDHRRSILVGVATTLSACGLFSTPANATPSDIVVASTADKQGFHLYRASQADSWHWRELATLEPGGDADDSWIGYHCTTDDGKYVVTVVAPRHVTNAPDLAGRVGSAYVVSLRTGKTYPLADGVALKYHVPGCGSGDRVSLIRYDDQNEALSHVTTFYASTRRKIEESLIRGHVTSPLPTAHGVFGVIGSTVVRLENNRAVIAARTTGQPFQLRPAPNGSLQFLVANQKQGEVWELRHKAIHLGNIDLESTSLLGRPGRHPILISKAPFHGQGVVSRQIPGLQSPVRTVSSDGTFIAEEHINPRSVSHSRHRLSETISNIQIVPQIRRVHDGTILRRKVPTQHKMAITRSVSSRSATVRTPNTTTPKCAVPRNDLHRQVPQPNSNQIDWAIQQAVRGNLKGSTLTRPANYLNMGLASYQPSNDFAPPTLAGGGTIPPSVVQALYAQESNWRQASWHALPGVSGNPLVSDYYGAGGGDSTIDYDAADCGYGVSQITDPMSTASMAFSANGKAKVAVDYTENIAAGIQILGDKWNQLYNAGVKFNGGDPEYLENWYGAIWAYNSGFHPDTGSGPWGLGWTNNPANSDYLPNRAPFLRITYADAAHPSDWPYQERVLGFMESPLLNYKGQRSYSSPVPSSGMLPAQIQYPNNYAFCDTSNECSSTYHNPSNPTLDYCMNSGRYCWWHQPATFAGGCQTGGLCNTSQFTFSSTATEPQNDNNYPPACNSSLVTGTIIVDDQANNINIEGCNSTNWSNSGTFSVVHGNSGGISVGVIDWHQLGSGLGGHSYFTHNRTSGDAAHLETGTWTPSGITPGRYSIEVHVPTSGATTERAQYMIDRGDGTTAVRQISQHLSADRWVGLGTFTLQPGAKVILSNVTDELPSTTDVAYDAVAFTKVASETPSDAQLAATFRPNLYFDSSEKWRPLDVDRFLTESSGTTATVRCLDIRASNYDEEIIGDPLDASPTAFGITASDDDSGETQAYCRPMSSSSQLLKWGGAGAFLRVGGKVQSTTPSDYHSPHPECVHDGILDCDGGETSGGVNTGSQYSKIYQHIGEISGHTFIQYWQFYRFNSYTDTGVTGSHQGDWEAVAIAPSADGSTFDYASFSQHGHWYSYLRGNLSCGGGSPGSCGTNPSHTGNHVSVFVANGSHGNYGFACSEVIPEVSCQRGAGGLPERGHDGSQAWYQNTNSPHGLAALPLPGNGGWSDWSGHWGATGTSPTTGSDSPRSPAAQAMFNVPWESCSYEFDNITACQKPVAFIRGSSRRSDNPTACRRWLGAGVTAVACDAHRARRGTSLSPSRGIKLTIVRKASSRGHFSAEEDRTATSNAVAQAVGSPLKAGDKVTVSGARSPLVVLVRASFGGRQVDLHHSLRTKRPTTFSVHERKGRLALTVAH